MKKLFVYGIAMLMLLASVATVSATDVVVDCGENSWWNPLGNYCQDYELQGEFNQVTDAIDNVDNRVDKVVKVNNKQNKAINAIEEDIASSEASWLQDRKGTSFSRVSDFLFGDFFNYLDGIFAKQSEVDELSARVEKLEAYVDYMNQGYTGIYEKGIGTFGYDSEGNLAKLD